MEPNKLKEVEVYFFNIIEVKEKTRFYVLLRESDNKPLAFLSLHLKEKHVIVFSNEKYAEQFLHNSGSAIGTDHLYVGSGTVCDGEVINGDGLYIYQDEKCQYHLIDSNKELKWDHEHGEKWLYIHSVVNDHLSEEERFDPILKFYNDMHTHGCCKYNHKEFQIVRNKDSVESRKLLETMYEMVRLGARFEPGDVVGKFISLACFQDRTTPTENVLRIIYADSNGKFPWEEGCEESYRLQTEDKW